MPAKLATESQWKSVVQKHKLKDNGLQKALALYEKLGDEKSQERVKALDAVKKLVSGLSKDKVVSANADVLKFLDGLEAGVEPAKKEAEAEAKTQDENQSELKRLFAETQTLAKATQNELADLSKQSLGACEDLRLDHLEAIRRVQETADWVGPSRSRSFNFRVMVGAELYRAIDAAIHAEKNLIRCLVNAHPSPEFKSHERQLSALKDQLVRKESQLSN